MVSFIITKREALEIAKRYPSTFVPQMAWTPPPAHTLGPSYSQNGHQAWDKVVNLWESCTTRFRVCQNCSCPVSGSYCSAALLGAAAVVCLASTHCSQWRNGSAPLWGCTLLLV